ncbi:hypothetical protein SESBI_50391 [Sesbania bispinosa]|nr:hypothetical protein SESBI_50391 [Sesbania bispinosa]
MMKNNICSCGYKVPGFVTVLDLINTTFAPHLQMLFFVIAAEEDEALCAGGTLFSGADTTDLIIVLQ